MTAAGLVARRRGVAKAIDGDRIMSTKFPPPREADLVTFTQNFSARISATPTTYSLTAAQATAYATLSTAFVNAYNVANAKATRSPMNISLKDAAKSSLLANLRTLARIVQNAPTTTNAMRDDLNLPHRGTVPSPVPAPGTPFKFKASLDQSGTVTLTWKCNNPKGSSGTMYQVYRRTGGTGEFAYLGGTGTKTFPDATIPAGTSSVTYLVQAVRSTSVGAPAQFNVSFGTSGGAPVVEDVAESSESPKMRRAA